MKIQRRISGLPYLPVVLAPLVLLAPVYLSGGALFWGTPSLQFVAWQSWAWKTLLAGHLPLWNPLLGMGAPLLANYQSALFYPPNWISLGLYIAGGVPSMAWGLSLLLAFHLILAGLGAAVLARALGLSALGQTVCGLAFGMCGYLVARGGFVSMVDAAAWLPWILWAALKLSRPGIAWKTLLLLGLLIGLQLLAGHAQVGWYTWLLTLTWVGYWSWHGSIRAENGASTRRRSFWRALLAGWGKLALALLIGCSLAAIQLLPTAEYLLQSQRAAEVDFEMGMTYSFWPWRLLTLPAPDLFGSPVQGNYWGYGNFWEDALYIGVLPFLLAIAAVSQALRRKNKLGDRRSLVFLLLGLCVVTVVLALGKNTPVFPWLYRHVFTFNMFQAPARYLIWLEIALALLAGIGALGWHRPQGRALYWTRLGTAGAVAISLGAWLAWYLMSRAHLLPEIALSFIRATAMLGFWCLLAGVLSLTAPPEPSNGPPGDIAQAGRSPGKAVYAWSWAVALVIMLNLLVAGWGINPKVSLDFYRQASPTAAEVRQMAGEGRLYLPALDEESLKFKRFFQFKTFDPGEDWLNLRAVLLPNLTLLDGLSSVNNFDPLLPGRYARWMASLKEAQPAQLEQLLNLMGVNAVEREDSSYPYQVAFQSAAAGHPVDAAQSAADRLRWVPCALPAASGEAAWEQIWDKGVDFQQQVILENAGRQPAAACDPQARGNVEFRESSPNEMRIHSQADQPGWIVIADTWYPGWQAWVDGRRAPLLRADYLFRGVPVDDGEHELRLVYQPASFWLGAAITLITAILAGWVLLRER